MDARQRKGDANALLGAERAFRGVQNIATALPCLFKALEEIGHRKIQHLGDGMEPAGANPIGAVFVFLNLLKTDTERIRELLLRNA